MTNMTNSEAMTETSSKRSRLGLWLGLVVVVLLLLVVGGGLVLRNMESGWMDDGRSAITASDWETAVSNPPYRADSLKTEGFIHCSTLAQVLGPANEFYHGQTGLVVLVIESDKVAPKIVYEDCYETGQQFPHIYGPLNVEAVVQVVDFPPNADGSFSLPASFTAL